MTGFTNAAPRGRTPLLLPGAPALAGRAAPRGRSLLFAVAVAATIGSLGGCAVSPPGASRGAGAGDEEWKRRLHDHRFVATHLIETRTRAAADTTEPYWPHHMAEVYAGIDSTAAAGGWLRESLARDPDYVPSLALFSENAYRMGRHEEAIELLEAARERQGPRFPVPLLAGLAVHYDAIGEVEQVEPLIFRLDAAGAKAVVSYLHLRRADRAKAAEAARAAVAADPRSAANHNNRGITQLLAGDPEGARASFEAAIELDPSLPGPYYNLAILERFYLMRDAEAAVWFERYWALSREDPDALEPVFRPGILAGGDDR